MGEAFLAIELGEGALPRRVDAAPGLHCLALAIDPTDRVAVKNHLVHAGIAIERETAFTVYVRDPDGNVIGLSHYPTPA